MTNSWKHVRANDRYRVFIQQPPSSYHLKLLTTLYQPLMGSLSYALYLTLVHETEGDHFVSSDCKHHTLMKTLSVHLEHFYQARLRLEALGLVQTFRATEQGESMFEYHLAIPLAPEKFFEDELLSISLFNQVGASRFKQLRARFSNYAVGDKPSSSSKKELTKQFHEVFTSVHSSELVIEEGTQIHKDMQHLSVAHPLPVPEENDHAASLSFERYHIDTQLLNSYLMNGFLIEDLLDAQQFQLLQKHAFFYRLDEYQLSQLLLESLDALGAVDMSIFQNKAKDWYRWQKGGQPPQLVQLIESEKQPVISTEDVNNEDDQHLFMLERISPLELMQEYQNGGKVADADQKLLEELLFQYELKPSVINLLIEYILLTNEFKLPRNLVTKVAAHWKRSGVEDVRQAQALALKEHEQYKQWQGRKEQAAASDQPALTQGKGNASGGKGQVGKVNAPKRNKTTYSGGGGYRGNKVRKDHLPDWIAQPPDEKSSSPISNEQKKRRIESLLKDLGEWDDTDKREK